MQLCHGTSETNPLIPSKLFLNLISDKFLRLVNFRTNRKNQSPFKFVVVSGKYFHTPVITVAYFMQQINLIPNFI